MESDSSSYIDTTYSVDLCIENYIKKNKEDRRQNKKTVECQRKAIYEDFVATSLEEYLENLNGLHLYTFKENKIKFGFNPSEVAHVSKRVKFICILKYTGNYWMPGRNTIPANWKQRIFDLFHRKKSVNDERILTVIEDIYSIFMEWSEEHEEFRKRKIQKYWNGEIDFLELNSEDEELYLSMEESEELKKKREIILQRMIPPKRRRKRIDKKENRNGFISFPNLGIDSD